MRLNAKRCGTVTNQVTLVSSPFSMMVAVTPTAWSPSPTFGRITVPSGLMTFGLSVVHAICAPRVPRVGSSMASPWNVSGRARSSAMACNTSAVASGSIWLPQIAVPFAESAVNVGVRRSAAESHCHRMTPSNVPTPAMSSRMSRPPVSESR